MLTIVIEEGKTLPKYGELYPQVHFTAEKSWPEKNKDVSTGLARLIEHIKTNADSIKEQRKKKRLENNN